MAENRGKKREKMSQKNKTQLFLGISKIRKHRKLRIDNTQLSMCSDS